MTTSPIPDGRADAPNDTMEKNTNDVSAARTELVRRPALGALLVVLAVSLLPAGARSQDEEAADVGAARTDLQEWVAVRKTIASEKRKWAEGRVLLEDRIAVVREQIDNYRASIAESEEKIADTGGRMAKLEAENASLKTVAEAIADRLVGLEARTRELLPRLPRPLEERLRPVSQSLPKAGEETELTITQRFTTVVTILNAVNKFHREVTVSNENRELADGSTASVAVLYAGLGAAYYVSPNGDAGVGASSPDGWVWTAADEIAADVTAAIEVLNNERPADFVRLPLEVR